MSSGVLDIKVIIAVGYNGDTTILDLPLRMADIIDNLYGNSCFTNAHIIPRKVGVYELICKYHWDNGYNLVERTDGGIEVEILKVNDLYISSIDCNIAIGEN